MKVLRDRVAVVTGAASGIGRALALGLASEGCHLAICDVNEVALAETLRELAVFGGRASAHRVDVADRNQMERFAQDVIREHGRVNLLVNNAGVGVAKTFEQHSFGDWEWILGINLYGVIHGCTFFLPHLRAAEPAHIVNISSLFGLVPIPLMPSYCATKAAIGAISESLAMELRRDRIPVTAVYPGGVSTNVGRSSRCEDERLRKVMIGVIANFSITPERCAKRIIKGIKRDEARIVVTSAAQMLESVKRVAPTLLHGVLARAYGGFLPRAAQRGSPPSKSRPRKS